MVGIGVASSLGQQPDVECDIVVYGGTSAGVAAALQAARLGRSVVLIEPTARLGGLTTGGLGQTDIGNKRAIGGIARQFYQRIQGHYAQAEAWRWQKRETYRDGGQTQTDSNEDAMWTFEPSAALKVYEAMARESKLSVVRGERLDRRNGVLKQGPRIIRISMESGRRFRGRVFIDATYEGDLMATTKVSYTVGREANRVYGETLNGIQTRNSVEHQLKPQVDPFIRKGDASSGLLPGIDPSGPGNEGEGDPRVQAYCFRLCLTDHPDNRLPIEKPEGYRELDYELMFRNFEAGENEIPWIHSLMPNRKTDINNRNGFSSDFIGQNYQYPDGDYATRQRIVERHRLYQQGLMFTLAHHPRVPEHVRQEVSCWGLCKDEFAEGNGWQQQLYIREARRLVGSYVMTQHNCLGHERVLDSVGLAAYTMDSHNVQRHVTKEGHARNEGNIEVGGFPPYPISYRALIPRRNECTNLLVPVCLSTSHIAFGSIRMEPVFMVLGQSAATAAHLALGESLAVQDVDYSSLRKRLLSDGQILEWSEQPKIARAGAADFSQNIKRK
ncbi:MAG: FAD-dependent oxidoreductase [Acidobacteria bacterium]|nr:FAD-dependent oxidoreductase [Acidobacteriota bacterium]